MLQVLLVDNNALCMDLPSLGQRQRLDLRHQLSGANFGSIVVISASDCSANGPVPGDHTRLSMPTHPVQTGETAEG